jgi:O-antigen/teichoic acid export membrane protein
VLFFLLYNLLGLKLSGFFLATIVVNFGLLILAYLDFKKKNLVFIIKKELLVEYLSFGLPQVGTGIGVVLLSAASRYFIQYFNNSDAVGVFSAAFKFGELSILLPLSIFTGIFAPFVYREFELNGKVKAFATILKYQILYILFFGPLFVLLYVFPTLPMILLGDNFRGSLSIIPIVCLGNFIFGYSQLLGLYSQIDFKPYVITISILIATVICVILNFFLIPNFGILGAAYTTLIAYIVYILLVIFLSNINYNYIPLKSFFALICTAGLFYCISQLMNNIETFLWVKFLFGLSIWVFLAFLLMAFKQIRIPNFNK